MIDRDREWRRSAGATPEALDALRSASPVELPDAYLALLRFSNGGEGPLSVQPLYFCLDSAEHAAEAIRSRAHAEFFAGFIVVGSNGAGEYIALDARASQPWPVVAIDMTNIDLAESVLPIAPNFTAFVDLIGLQGGGG